MTDDNVAWLLRRLGPVSNKAIIDALPDGMVPPDLELLIALRGALYPDSNTVLAYNISFAMRTGIVPGGIDHLILTDVTRTGPASVLLSYFKGRPGYWWSVLVSG